MPTFKPSPCCKPKHRAMNASLSKSLKKLNSTPAGRKAAQKAAKASHAAAVHRRAVKAKQVKAKKAKAAAFAASPAGKARSAKAERDRIAAMRLPTKQSGTTIPKPRPAPPCRCKK